MAIINGFDNVDDNISGVPRGDTLFSSTYGGNDTVLLISADYEVYLGEGNDRLSGGRSGVVYGEAGNDRLDAFLWEGAHAHYGGEGDDSFLAFYGGTDVTYIGSGGAGTDRFVAGSNDVASLTFDGGDGYDVVTHNAFTTTGISLTLNGTGTQGGALLTYAGIEAVVATAGADTMTGSRADNLLVGGGGADVISGVAGNDFLIGEGRESSFVNAFIGLNFNFSVADAFDPLNSAFGGAYATDSGATTDSLYGGIGNDVLSGGDGADLLDGGKGSDWVTYLSSPEGTSIVANLSTGGTVGHAAGDVYIGIENVQGSNYNDTLTGNNLANEIRGMFSQDSLSGLAGNDTLLGAQGRDTLTGGKDRDVLTGGDAEDAFVFTGDTALQSVDTITDFQVNFDEIWLSAATFRKMGPLGALSAERFALGTAADAGDRIIYDAATGALSYDADGNGSGAAIRFAQLATGLALTEGDFVLIA
jgi:serralysin